MEKKSLKHMRTARVQASLRFRAVSSEPMLIAHVRGKGQGNSLAKELDMCLVKGSGMRTERIIR